MKEHKSNLKRACLLLVFALMSLFFLTEVQAQTISDGYYVITNGRHTSYYLQPAIDEPGSVLKISQGCTTNKLWKMTNLSGDDYYLQNYSSG